MPDLLMRTKFTHISKYTHISKRWHVKTALHTLTYTLNNLNYGSRFCQIIHVRLRLGCSDLKATYSEFWGQKLPSLNLMPYFLHIFLYKSEFFQIFLTTGSGCFLCLKKQI